MEQNKTFNSGKGAGGDTWYVDNYVLLKEYYDMISLCNVTRS